jgi:hypothetical protein
MFVHTKTATAIQYSAPHRYLFTCVTSIRHKVTVKARKVHGNMTTTYINSVIAASWWSYCLVIATWAPSKDDTGIH